MKILLIDDDRIIHILVRHIVEVLDVELTVADNGKEGFKLLEQEGAFDAIILDWVMPKMNGLEFLKKLRAEHHYRDIPVLMLTSVTQEDRMAEALKAGATQYLTKPFTNEALLTRLVDMMKLDAPGLA